MLAKRLMDLAILASAHVLLGPLWLLLWSAVPLAIWLEDRGPIFYRQRRLGLNGRPFNVLKFRTMIPDAEKHTGAVWATKDDPRITRVGRILRRTALDELPQVINIARGDMSFVGPRSERPELHAEFAKSVPGFERRLAVMPGLTGLAQVKGDYNLPPADKLAYDLEYIRRRSLWLDVRLLVASVGKTFTLAWDHKSVDGTSARS